MSIITLGYHNSVQESKQHLKYTILHKQHALIIIPFEIFLFFLGGGCHIATWSMWRTEDSLQE